MTKILPPMPVPLPVKPENIPKYLKDISQWVTWRYMEAYDKQDNPLGKWAKILYRDNGLDKSASNAPKKWSTFDKVLATYQRSPFHQPGVGDIDIAGIGFVMMDPAQVTEAELASTYEGIILDKSKDVLVGVDLDNKIHATNSPEENAIIDAEHAMIIQRFDSYAEISPSGNGKRIFVRGKLPPSKEGRKNEAYEIYDHHHYLTITGHHIPDSPLTVEHRQEAIDWYHETYIAKKKRNEQADPKFVSFVYGEPPKMSDDDIIEKISKAKNSEKFKALWNAIPSEGQDGSPFAGYPSHSEADLALLGMLTFYTHDNTQLYSLLSKSGCNRSKWHRHDYANQLIGKALIGNKASYQSTKTVATPASSELKFRHDAGTARTLSSNTNPHSMYAGSLSGYDIDLEAIDARVPEYLATNRFFARSLSAFIGDPSAGKSMLAALLIRAITKGEPLFPDDKIHHTPKRVILLCNEDDENTIKRRLLAVGADISKVKLVKGLRDNNGTLKAMTVEDIQAIEKFIIPFDAPSNEVEHDVGLVIVDPLVSFVGGKFDMNQSNQVRNVMQPLLFFAQKYKVSVLLNIHVKKSSDKGKSFKQIIGSADFAASIASIFYIGHFSDDKKRHFLTTSRIKEGNEDAVKSLEFAITGVDITAKDENGNDVIHSQGRANWIGWSNVKDTELASDKKPESLPVHDLLTGENISIRDQIAEARKPTTFKKDAPKLKSSLKEIEKGKEMQASLYGLSQPSTITQEIVIHQPSIAQISSTKEYFIAKMTEETTARGRAPWWLRMKLLEGERFDDVDRFLAEAHEAGIGSSPKAAKATLKKCKNPKNRQQQIGQHGSYFVIEPFQGGIEGEISHPEKVVSHPESHPHQGEIEGEIEGGISGIQGEISHPHE